MKKLTISQKLDRILEILEPKAPVVQDNLRTIVDDGKQKTSEIIAEMRKLFKVWIYDEKNVDKEFPAPEYPTSRKFRNIQEADPDMANKSANDLEKESIKGITLRERLLFELAYFKETDEHLDVENLTLCSGSRYSDGRVPGVRWDARDGRVGVGWYDADYRYSYMRGRVAVS